MVEVNMNENCQFLKDLNDNSSNVNRGVYNLICTKRDLQLFSKGIKPHRRWTLKSVKNYFGLQGNTESILAQIETILYVEKNRKGAK